MAMATRKSTEENNEMITYVDPARIRVAVPPMVSRTKLATSMILEADVEVDEVSGQEGAGDACHEDEVGGVEDADRCLVVAVGHALAQRSTG